MLSWENTDNNPMGLSQFGSQWQCSLSLLRRSSVLALLSDILFGDNMDDRRKHDAMLIERLDQIERMIVHSRDLPQSETQSRLFADMKRQIEGIDRKLDEHMTDASKKLAVVDDIMQFGKVGTLVFNAIVKMVVGLGVLASALYGFKIWILK